MKLNIMEKILVVFNSFFSSFMSIEILLIGFLLFIFLILNAKKNVKLVKIFLTFIYLVFFTFICIYYQDYVVQSVDGLLKYIMKYIYFPSLAMYFILMVFVTLGMIYTMFSIRISSFLRYLNICIFSLLHILYFQVIGLVVQNKIYFTTDVEIYKNETILSLVQISNLLLFIWILIMMFYQIYQYLRRKFDERKEIT